MASRIIGMSDLIQLKDSIKTDHLAQYPDTRALETDFGLN